MCIFLAEKVTQKLKKKAETGKDPAKRARMIPNRSRAFRNIKRSKKALLTWISKAFLYCGGFELDRRPVMRGTTPPKRLFAIFEVDAVLGIEIA